MKKLQWLLILCAVNLFANDSEYYTSGNQLVPLQSNNVRLEKEVLTIRHVKDYTFDVDVKYTLFNERGARETLIGFESVGQIGDAEPESFFDKKYDDKKLLNAEREAIAKFTGDYENCYVTHFKVMVNGKKATYKTADVSQIKKDKNSSPYVGSLYYFPVYLKRGLNHLHQTYRFDGDNSRLFYAYEFSYILETAKRWKGGKIKEFTLVLDMGDNEEFTVVESFFKGTKSWRLEDGNIIHRPDYEQFYIRQGKVIFHKKNFIPNGTIFLKGAESIWSSEGVFDAKKDILPFAYHDMPNIAKDATSLQILKAFPYARHGAIFKEKFLNSYFKKCLWYKRDSNYRKHFSSLDKESKTMLLSIELLKHKILRNLPYAKRGYVFKDYDLKRFFYTNAWYKENEKYKANPSDLSQKELKWRDKVTAKRSIGDVEFFDLIEEYLKIWRLNR